MRLHNACTLSSSSSSKGVLRNVRGSFVKKNQSFRRFAELDVISTPLLLTGRPRFFPFVSACLSTDSGLN